MNGFSSHLLGIRPEYDGLLVQPCIPANMRGFTVTRKFCGTTYEIKVSNPDKVQKGLKHLIVDGKEIEGNIIPILSSGKIHQVEVIMG